MGRHAPRAPRHRRLGAYRVMLVVALTAAFLLAPPVFGHPPADVCDGGDLWCGVRTGWALPLTVLAAWLLTAHLLAVLVLDRLPAAVWHVRRGHRIGRIPKPSAGWRLTA